ncbi:MAG: glycosyltransferase family 4 protein [Candidatus Wildermuthbacteria bacterium]|nr:glycosyltransferase family 4 protein [Candidatus Wildermuthbacteria bacterium]
MRIGFFTDTYLPSSFGLEISVETFRENLENMGHRVYIFAPSYPHYKDANPRVFRFRSLKIIKKPEMRFAFPFLPTGSVREIMKLKLDIVHIHTPLAMGFLGKYIASVQRIPAIYTHHTQIHQYAKVYFKKMRMFPYVAKVLSTWFANSSGGVIAPSVKIKKMLKEWKTKKTITILPTGVNVNLFKKSADAGQKVKEKLNIPPEKKVLLFVGRMSKEKNIEFLLKAFKETLKKTSLSLILIMVGDGPDLEKLRQFAKKNNLNDSVIFTGHIPHKEIPPLYQAADAFLFSSLTETQGIVILEAMASGLPIVALEDDAFQGLISHGENGFLIKKPSTEIFSQKILKLLNSHFLMEKFSKNSRKIAEKLSAENQTKKLLAIYRRCL